MNEQTDNEKCIKPHHQWWHRDPKHIDAFRFCKNLCGFNV